MHNNNNNGKHLKVCIGISCPDPGSNLKTQKLRLAVVMKLYSTDPKGKVIQVKLYVYPIIMMSSQFMYSKQYCNNKKNFERKTLKSTQLKFIK
jgi:hypothetical protein